MRTGRPSPRNVEKAKTRIEAVRAAADQGTQALASGTAGIAAHAARGSVRMGWPRVPRSSTRSTGSPPSSRRRGPKSTPSWPQLTADLALVRKAAAAAGPPDPDAARKLGEVDQLLLEARTALDLPKPDVTGAYDKARRANAAADAIAAGIRDAQEEAARALARLKASLYSAKVA